MRWPEGTDPARRAGTGATTLRAAGDLALLGVVTTLAALPLVTAGPAVATASAALHHWIEHDRWPGARPVLDVFRRGLLPGAAATVVAAAVAALLGFDLLALARGAVPGGPPLLAVTAGLLLATAGYAGLTVVELGRAGGQGWCSAARNAATELRRRPLALPAAAGVLALATLLGLLVLPPLTPLLAGYTLFALHVVARRAGRPAVGVG